MSEARLILQRRPQSGDDPTQGSFYLVPLNGTIRALNIRSMELPWKENQQKVSSIPASEEYRLVWTRSSRFSKEKGYDVMMWEVRGVPGRAGIRIHSGNYAGVNLSDSLGCILPCFAWADINKDGVVDGVRSKEAMKALLKALEPYQKEGIAFSVRNAVKREGPTTAPA